MRIATAFVLACSLLGLGLAASSALAGPIVLNPAVRTEFTNCSASGSSASSLVVGKKYLMRITDEDTFVCFTASASTCASGGEKFSSGFAALVEITDDIESVSCRSTNATGDVIFTKVD